MPSVLSQFNSIYVQINEAVNNHLNRLLTEPAVEKDGWVCIADQGDLKVFKRELEENGIPVDPMKAVCTVKVRACSAIVNICM